ncbi:putative coiled-coil protein SlyX [Leucobacter exalbidus]|uniref:Coiled-coil protein SlyX n=1 Tax=Leucobacter exalbidus TaxID=662960 RepID=A0A940T531_9MICO|nr:DUF4349 domain-containing protein [Leucobacter exalbidus]MBP1327434.1 putative coiled-coil protein SlyX [Leucobacter exalbidus]
MHRFRLAPLVIVAGLALVGLAGCAGGASSSSSSHTEATLDARLGSSETMAPEVMAPDGMPPGVIAPNASAAGAMAPEVAEPAAAAQHVITTAEIVLESQHPDTAADEVSKVAKQLGGSVESLTVQRATGDAPASATLAVRVPAAAIDDAIAAISQSGTVRSESRSAQDVTASYVDIEARVQALETSVTRLNRLIADATTTSDLLEAESALTQRQQELDGLRAQLAALKDQVQQSTIWVSITAPSVLPGGGPGSFWEGLVTGVSSLAAAAAGALVVLGVLVPWLVVVAVIAFAVVVTVRVRRSHRARAAQPDDQTQALP